MYFLAGSDECLKVIPALAVMSSSCGIGRPVHSVAFAPGCGGGGMLCPSCAREVFVPQSIRKIVGKARRMAFLFNLVPLSGVLSSGSRRWNGSACSWAFVSIHIFHHLLQYRYSFKKRYGVETRKRCMRQPTETPTDSD